jgi:hypothetical protein
MRHYSEDELILYHYGEGRRRNRVDTHLQTCRTCSVTYRDIAATLAIIRNVEVPHRDDRYGLEVWQRIRHDLPPLDAPWWIAWRRLTLASAVAVLVVAAFVTGRFWPQTNFPRVTSRAVDAGAGGPAANDATERVRVAALGDHLEESERVLLGFMNADATVDLADQQAWAAALVGSNRLYRDAAAHAGDATTADVLDELERSLLDIVHGPATLTPVEIEQARLRLDAAALLFKVRVLSEELRERELGWVKPRKTT